MIMSMKARICCGCVIDPHLIAVPNRYGLRLSIAVSHCAICGEMSAEYVFGSKKADPLGYIPASGQRRPQPGVDIATKTVHLRKRRFSELS